jgi:ribosomal protein S18 acetylase RimI-like enzyme
MSDRLSDRLSDRHRPAAAPVARVTALGLDDLRVTAGLHIRYLPTGLFPRLGQAFVRRWHRTFVDSARGVALVVKDTEGGVCGFLLGTSDQDDYLRDVLGRDRRALAWRGLVGLLLRPSLAMTFMRTRSGRYARRLARRRPAERSERSERSATPADPAHAVAVLHAIIVLPQDRETGIGRLLLEEFERAVAAAGAPVIRLVTRLDGGGADFYRRTGYTETGTRRDKDGVEIVEFERRLGRG